MTSKKQIEANRRNAQRSTGPRTPAGVERAKLNALRHGLAATAFLLPSEDPERLAAFRRTVCEELQPEGWLEHFYVDNIIVYAWRLQRAHRMEAGVLMHAEQVRRARPDAVQEAVAAGAKVTPIPTDLEAAAKHLEGRATLSLGESFLDAAGPLQLLSRYETAIYRKLRDALTALETAQAARVAAEPDDLRALDRDL
jgi:hypothetical protein